MSILLTQYCTKKYFAFWGTNNTFADSAINKEGLKNKTKIPG